MSLKSDRSSALSPGQKAKAFLDRHKVAVLTLARKPLGDLLGSADVHSLIQGIESDDSSAALMPPRRDMIRGEDAFWFCVMQLDEFGSIDWPGAVHEPFLHQLHRDLQQAADCLSHQRDLPKGMTVQWMDDDAAGDWEESGEPGGVLDSMFTIRPMDPKKAGLMMLSMPLPKR